MTTSTSSRFPRLGFGLARKSPRAPPPQEEQEDNWYIPYNGPFEIPVDLPQPRYRDSWGHVQNTAVDEGSRTMSVGETVGVHYAEDNWVRARALSEATMSSGVMDPQRRSVVQPSSAHSFRFRSSTSNAPHFHTSSFTKPDGTGGVDQSPMPIQRYQNHPPSPPHSTNRLSLAGFFNVARKSISLSGHEPSTHPRSPASRAAQGRRLRASTVVIQPERDRNSAEDDYYNSYYSTLQANGPSGSTDPNNNAQSLSPHPYAYPFPSSSVVLSASERRAPLMAVSPSSYKGKGVDNHHQYPRPPPINTLGTSVPNYLKPSIRNSLSKAISTPNLRTLPRHQVPSPASAQPTTPRRKHRWLSPETWCDALLFPRPRFTVHEIDDSTPPKTSGSGRIVSPPESPLAAWETKPTEASPQSDRPKAGRSGSSVGRRLPKSLSAVNLSTSHEHAVAGPSRIPVDANPSLLAPEGHGRRSRPKSFAQDDLALPSPVPSLATVLEAGENLKRERQVWHTQASNSFQNKRIRSISRTRSKSFGHVRTRLKEKDNAVGSIDFLAERTFFGIQALAPTVHVPSSTSAHTRSGTTTISTTSLSRAKSHARSNSLGNTASQKSEARGHSRNESWGNAALRTAAGICFNADQVSPGEEHKSAFDTSLKGEGTKTLRLEEQMRREQDGSLVVGLSATDEDEGGTAALVSSPTPSGMTISAEGLPVGIALSSPPPSEGHSEDPNLSLPDHPYAQGGFSTSINRHPHHQHQRSTSTVRQGSDYAGPHLSSPHIMAIPPVNDVSARHRLPPHVTLHPYANVSAASHWRDDGIGVNPRSTAYSPIASGVVREVLPEEIQPSPGPIVRQNNSVIVPATHAYAAGNRDSGGPLEITEALSRALRRRGSADSGLGTSASEDHNANRFEKPLEPALPLVATTDARRVPIHHPYSYYPQLVQANTQTTSSHSNHIVASSPPECVNPPFFKNIPSTRATFDPSAHSSPGIVSQDSSPPVSPRPFSSMDDLDRFRDLFWKPHSRTPSDEVRKASRARQLSAGIPFDISSHSSQSGSGLMNLTRQLSEELETMREHEDELMNDSSSSSMWGRRFGGLRDDRPSENHTDPNTILSIARADSPEPMSAALPLRLHRMQGRHSLDPPTINIPEDVGSSRASSILERSPLDEFDNERVLRLGSIEAVTTPPVEMADHRFSGHLSLVGDVGGRRSMDGSRKSDELATRTPRHISQGSSLVPPHSARDMARSSYVTTDTSQSRMSGLSDFPAPPEQLVVSPAHVGLLQSYFSDTSQSHIADPFLAEGVRRRPTLVQPDTSYRSTFGREAQFPPAYSSDSNT
ncbi:hypothetical protein EW146_g3662 [Bondarzewia mesenterica]|uniref:Uncharacterized protein n=1 Tax=Bondarzewia mesenterica TaxID=1095465 RepID=A0A4S4LX40_9AGAM|nr:hypothetical protein EW146_g3662 [Bondarzewia mesenterica]